MACSVLPTVENGRARIVELPPDDKGVVKQGMEIDIELKPFVWADGTPLTARDFQFTIEVGKHPKSGVSSTEDYRRMVKFDIKDDRHFTLTMDRVTFDYNNLDLMPLPARIEKPIFDADPGEYRNKTAYDTDPTNPGLAFGPYRIVELVRAAASSSSRTTGRVTSRNSSAWSSRSSRTPRRWRPTCCPAMLDWCLGEVGLSSIRRWPSRSATRTSTTFVYRPSLIYAHIDVKLDNPLLTDRRVPKRFSAIDRKTISDKLFDGSSRWPTARSIH
jgi:peptide/nickel transport system substrate-binding protein